MYLIIIIVVLLHFVCIYILPYVYVHTNYIYADDKKVYKKKFFICFLIISIYNFLCHPIYFNKAIINRT